MLKIGLTGGIGSGKSTVAHFFSELGVQVIEADTIAQDLTAYGTPAYLAIVDHFGQQVVSSNGLNRKKLREIIFNSPEEKYWLESLLHPLIKQKIQQETVNSPSPYCVIVIPLLIETQSTNLIDRVLVVESSFENQLKRSMKRDASDEAVIKLIINQQASKKERAAIAADIMTNDSDITSLKKKVKFLHQKYLQLSNQS